MSKFVKEKYLNEESKSMCEGRFQSIDKKALTPDGLMSILEEGKIVFAVRGYEGNTCEVRSLAMIDGEVILYCPIHSLFRENEECDDGWEKVTATNLEDWRNEFAKEETLVDLYKEFHLCLDDDKDNAYKCVANAIDYYISDENEDFAGFLEIDFIEEWLRLNEDYWLVS